MTVLLHQLPAPAWPRLRNPSPFCLKLETYLRLAQVPYEVRPGRLHQAPTGKLPYLRDESGELVGDSQLILEHLQRTHGDPLDGGLDAQQRAQSHVLRGLLEERTYFLLAWLRWTGPHSWPVLRAYFVGQLPPLLGPVLVNRWRSRFIVALEGQGVGRHDRAEVAAMLGDDLEALSTLLGDRPYFLGTSPTSLDAIAYAFLVNILWVPWDDEGTRLGRTLPRLGAYCERVHARAYGPRDGAGAERAAAVPAG